MRNGWCGTDDDILKPRKNIVIGVWIVGFSWSSRDTYDTNFYGHGHDDHTVRCAGTSTGTETGTGIDICGDTYFSAFCSDVACYKWNNLPVIFWREKNLVNNSKSHIKKRKIIWPQKYKIRTYDRNNSDKCKTIS